MTVTTQVEPLRPVKLPALEGSIALGWLAAVGVLRLVSLVEPEARLSWDPDDGCAVLHSCRLDDVAAVVQVLRESREALAPGQFWPDTPPGFPPPGEAPDKLVVKREDFAELLGCWDGAEQVLSSLVTDLAVNAGGISRRTPMVAPTGKQSFFTMVRNQHEAVADPTVLAEALMGWVRRPGVGEAFDATAIVSAADAADGRAGERAVPGATWLAVQALPAFRLAGNGRSAEASGWRRVGRDLFLVWALWTPPLTLTAIRVLLEHPMGLRVEEGRLSADVPGLAPLGVWRVCAARRRSTGNSDGPLVPVAVQQRILGGRHW